MYIQHWDGGWGWGKRRGGEGLPLGKSLRVVYACIWILSAHDDTNDTDDRQRIWIIYVTVVNHDAMSCTCKHIGMPIMVNTILYKEYMVTPFSVPVPPCVTCTCVHMYMQ